MKRLSSLLKGILAVCSLFVLASSAAAVGISIDLSSSSAVVNQPFEFDVEISGLDASKSYTLKIAKGDTGYTVPSDSQQVCNDIAGGAALYAVSDHPITTGFTTFAIDNATTSFSGVGDNKKIVVIVLEGGTSCDKAIGHSSETLTVESSVPGAGAIGPVGTPATGVAHIDSGPITLSPGQEISDALGVTLAGFIRGLLMLAGFFFVIAIIYSGILMLVAKSDEDAQKAKKNITWAIYGAVAVTGSVWFVNAIIRLLR